MSKPCFLLICALILLSKLQGHALPEPPTSPEHACPSPIRVENFGGKGRRSGTLVRIRLADVTIRVAIAGNRIGATESLEGMAKRYGAVAAINGSYFQAYNSGSFKPPVMNLITGGLLYRQGDIGTMMGFTAGNQVFMDRASIVNYEWKTPHGGNWRGVREAMGCGPCLVRDDQISLNPRIEGFRDPKVLSLSTARSAVGVTSGGDLLLVTTSGTMSQLAVTMQSLGCQIAMNLDGGASSGLWTSARMIRKAGRRLSNALLVLPR